MKNNIVSSFILSFFITTCLMGQSIVPFDEAYWDLSAGEVTEYLGRKALAGNAILKDVDFENGIIEVDIAIADVRQKSYPGIVFRQQEEGMSEHLYIRPHRAPIYADALQYAPVFNGTSCWQFCNGPGYTSQIVIPAETWNHLKIEVQGKQARVYWNNLDEPAMIITDLKHGLSRGSIRLSKGPTQAAVYFSNFKVQHDEDLPFDSPPTVEAPKGIITDWEISRAYPAGRIRVSQMKYPQFFVIASAQWEKVQAEPSGLVNVSKHRKRSTDQPDMIFARTIFQSDKKQDILLDFGYSDQVLIFHNGKPVFHGVSLYTSRDPSFLGIVGFHDAVYLTLEKGRNEIFLILKEWFGGWGFMAKADKPLGELVKDHSRLTQAWEISEKLHVPESVLYSPKQNVLYVTNFNPRFQKDAEEAAYKGYISQLSLDGTVLKEKWAAPLHAPTGMAIYKNRLYTLERRDLCEIDLKTGAIRNRYPIPDVDFPNDLAVDKKGNIYISDTSPADWTKGKIYKFSKGTFEVWLDGYEAWRPNGMYIHSDKLVFGGAAGDPFFKTVDLKTKRTDRVASLGAGTVDGFRLDNKGNYIVSHWEGQIYSVTPSGEVTELMNALGRFNTADFEYISEKDLLIIPTFFSNKVIAFKLGD